jgi:hypothetical protein
VASNSLEQLQRRFWKLITAPSGVAKALPEEAQVDPEIAPLQRWISSPNEEFAQERLDIYANMYFYRLLDALKADYPKILALIGDVAFHNLVTDYVLHYPSENPSLRYLGERFPAFIKTSERAKAWPYLYDLAVLEWARNTVFDVEDMRPMTREEMSAFPPEEWVSLVLKPIEALEIISLSAPVHRVWLAIEKKEEIPEIEAGLTSIVVWRWGHQVYHRPLAPKEASALALLKEGAPFYLLCECFEEPDEDISVTATRTLEAINRWLDDGLIGSAELSQDED